MEKKGEKKTKVNMSRNCARNFYEPNNLVKVKVKCTLVQALRLCTGRTAHRESRGIALLFHDHSKRRGWGVSVTPQPFFNPPPRKDPVSIVQEVGWAPGPVWIGAENLAPTRIRSPDRPAHSQSLYQLSYPSPQFGTTEPKLLVCWNSIDWE